MNIVILGLSITSSWGNGHATTFRGLVSELSKRGHAVTFLERDVPWYASQRDLANPPYCKTYLYSNLTDLENRFSDLIAGAQLVIVGSYVPEGVQVGEFAISRANGIVAFYDIDTPVTLAKLEHHDYEYLHPDLIRKYHIYLSFTGGPTLEKLEKEFGSPMSRPFYCSFDPHLYYPDPTELKWDLGYLGTYSEDRQPPLERLMLDAARKSNYRFVVAGPQYPENIEWPGNVDRIQHLPPADHRQFYNGQRFTMNITRADMIRAGYSPSVRLFEAAACGTPIISDYWQGIETLFEPSLEILISESAEQTLDFLNTISDEERKAIGIAARNKVMMNHTAAHRAVELENYYQEAISKISLQQTPA